MQPLITELESVLSKLVGRIVAQSILRNQAAKLGKDLMLLNAADCSVLIPNLVSSLALFAGEKEAEMAQSELIRLVKVRTA